MEDLRVTLSPTQKFGLFSRAFYISFARWEPHQRKGFHLVFIFKVAPIMLHRARALAHGAIQQRVSMV